MNPIEQFKQSQKEGWANFIPVEIFTTPPAAKLVNFSGLTSGNSVLDVGCGTGVVAITAAQKNARVKGLDLSPVLIERAKFNSKLAQTEIEFTEGDAEALPYKDAEFDFVLSQFGHMFAPRPEVVISEMLRVLKPGGTIAFSTWPPELFTGKMFALVGKYLPPPPGITPPPLWGNIEFIKEKLSSKVSDICFDRDVMQTSALSVQHIRTTFETTVAPIAKLLDTFKNDAEKTTQLRRDLENIIREFRTDNYVRQHFLMTKARKI